MADFEDHGANRSSDLTGKGRRRSGWRKLQAAPQAENLEWIGRQLGRTFDNVLEEPLPERFAFLLMQLDERERKGGAR